MSNEIEIDQTKPFIFRVSKECQEGTCGHVAGTGLNCAHMHRAGTRYMEPLTGNKCNCAAVREEETKKVDPTMPFIFKACEECIEGNCTHWKESGGLCRHGILDRAEVMWAQSFYACSCRTIKKELMEVTELFENKTPYHPADQALKDMANKITDAQILKRRHDYTNKYMPSHCCACGKIKGYDGPSCVPVSTEEAHSRVEANIGLHTQMQGMATKAKTPEAVVPVIYRGNLSPLYPVTWGLIGGPLAQRRRA